MGDSVMDDWLDELIEKYKWNIHDVTIEKLIDALPKFILNKSEFGEDDFYMLSIEIYNDWREEEGGGLRWQAQYKEYDTYESEDGTRYIATGASACEALGKLLILYKRQKLPVKKVELSVRRLLWRLFGI
jgi:hypothetical protein